MCYEILLVDDDAEMFELIELYNKNKNYGHHLHYLSGGKELTNFLENHHIDLILMDWNLAGESGLELIKDLKGKVSTQDIPIVLLTGRSQTLDQVLGLNSGADDYIVKPVETKLLFSKINALLRRVDKEKNHHEQLMKKFIFLDDTLEVEFHGKTYKLTHKEFVILKTLVENPQKVFSQEELNALTSGKDVYVSRRCVDTFITILRKKIGKECILSVRKKGYKINDKFLNEETVNPPVSSPAEVPLKPSIIS